MKNIITILLILILPIIAYLIMNKNSEQIMAVAKENPYDFFINNVH